MIKLLKIKDICKYEVLRKKIYLIILFFVFLVGFISFNSIFKESYYYNLANSNNKKPEIGFIWAQLDLTNPAEINNSQFPHYTSINVEGRVYNPYAPIANDGLRVEIVVDGESDSRYSDLTDSDGNFSINYIVDPSLDVYISHIIEANVTDPEPGGPDSEIQYHHFYIIDVNATSYLDTSYPDHLYMPGEMFHLEGFLRYDNANGTGIMNQQITYNWYNTSDKWSSDFYFTNSFGSLTTDLPIPNDVYSQTISLNLSYPGDPYYIESTEIIIPKIKLFADVIWQNIEIPTKASEGDNITISGQIISRDNTSLKLYNRTVTISHAGNQVDAVETDSNGFFTSTYRIPSGAGFRTIRISLANTGGFNISIEQDINVSAAIYVPRPSTDLPPFFLFSVIFFPLLAVIVGVLIVYGIRYYKKQEKESRVVDLPLESKLINLKILKDTGRLEESLSYLFNAIFMDLINAKYGRIRKETETIRDFAIISVKELKLTPAAIYPFIQKVEEVIYAKPYKITDNDFYETCGLFSPIYFQLTGYNFVLNF